MKKTTNLLIFSITLLFHTGFYYLCGYFQKMMLNRAWYIDLIFGIIAIIVLSMGMTSVIVQIYYRNKYRSFQKRVFDFRLLVQSSLLLLYYLFTICLTLVMVFTFSIFYFAVLALFLSTCWMRGSRVLWSSERETYYLNEKGKLFTVMELRENDEAIELDCTIAGDRDRTITIHKRKPIEKNDGLDLYD